MGKAKVRGTAMGLLIRGFSWTHLFFAPGGDPESEYRVVDQGRGREAFHCERCGSLEITSNAWIKTS